MAREAKPDVITLDVLMPGMDGWAVLKALKSDPVTADIPVVMVSMVDDKDIGYALGASDYVLKPFDREKLSRGPAPLQVRGAALPGPGGGGRPRHPRGHPAHPGRRRLAGQRGRERQGGPAGGGLAGSPTSSCSTS